MLVLHLFVLQQRLKAAGEAGARAGRALAELFVAEMDNALREMGVGDMGIPRRVKQAAEAYNGRLIAYGKAVAEGDPVVIEAALARNVFGQAAAPSAGNPGPARLSAHLRAAIDAVGKQPTEAILDGKVAFPRPMPSRASNAHRPEQDQP